jgi:hypothetical protein
VARPGEHETLGLRGLMERRRRMQEGAKRPAHERLNGIHQTHAHPHKETVAREAQKERTLCETGRNASQPDAFRRAADHAVQDDDVCALNRCRLVENIRHTKRASALEAFLPCELPRVRLIGGDELDDLSTVGACREQLGLDRADASADFQDPGSGEFSADSCHHPTFDFLEPPFSISLEAPARKPRVEHLFARAGVAATSHGLTDGGLDAADPLRQAAWLQWDQLEAKVSVRLFVNLLELERLREADATRFGGGDEAKVADEKNPGLVNPFFLDPLQFAAQKRR